MSSRGVARSSRRTISRSARTSSETAAIFASIARRVVGVVGRGARAESLGRASSSSAASLSVATRADVVCVVVVVVGREDALESMNHAHVARERSERALDAYKPTREHRSSRFHRARVAASPTTRASSTRARAADAIAFEGLLLES